jgi:hypothetical protein
VNISDRPARQRGALSGRLARDRLDLGDLLRGENDAVDPIALDLTDQPGDRPRIFAATD